MLGFLDKFITFIIFIKFIWIGNVIGDELQVLPYESASQFQSTPTQMQSGICFRQFPIHFIEKTGWIITKNGQLIQPSNTVLQICCNGFEPYFHDDSKCQPKCEGGCHNGNCIRTNICICDANRVPNPETGECMETCPISCRNGQCHANGTCNCKPGYKHVPNRKYCEAICDQSCGDRKFCSAPNTCTYKKGYSQNTIGDYEPTCSMHCLNGRCVDVDKCHCNPGYSLKDKVCQANCTLCENGKCIFNDVCACDPGYTLDKITKQCLPACSNCEHGVCVSPEFCRCHPGYEKKNGICVPSCRLCVHGTCVAPEKCNCHDGYAKGIAQTCGELDCSFGILGKSCYLWNYGKPGFWGRLTKNETPTDEYAKALNGTNPNYPNNQNNQNNNGQVIDPNLAAGQGIAKVITG